MDTVSLADPSACIVEHSILRAKVLDALASNNVAMVFRRTGWKTTESCISCKGDRIRAPSVHDGTNTSTLKLRCKMCGGTTRPDGGLWWPIGASRSGRPTPASRTWSADTRTLSAVPEPCRSTPEPSRASPEPRRAAPEPRRATPEPRRGEPEPSRAVPEPRRGEPEPCRQLPEPWRPTRPWRIMPA